MKQENDFNDANVETIFNSKVQRTGNGGSVKAYQKMFKKVKNPIEFIWDDENER